MAKLFGLLVLLSAMVGNAGAATVLGEWTVSRQVSLTASWVGAEVGIGEFRNVPEGQVFQPILYPEHRFDPLTDVGSTIVVSEDRMDVFSPPGCCFTSFIGDMQSPMDDPMQLLVTDESGGSGAAGTESGIFGDPPAYVGANITSFTLTLDSFLPVAGTQNAEAALTFGVFGDQVPEPPVTLFCLLAGFGLFRRRTSS